MHFNDLLIRTRLQAMGGLVGGVTIAGLALKDTSDLLTRYRGLLLLSLVFIAGWLAVAILDLGYYRRLLLGAVDELLRLEDKEKKLPEELRLSNVQLSTTI